MLAGGPDEQAEEDVEQLHEDRHQRHAEQDADPPAVLDADDDGHEQRHGDADEEGEGELIGEDLPPREGAGEEELDLGGGEVDRALVRREDDVDDAVEQQEGGADAVELPRLDGGGVGREQSGAEPGDEDAQADEGEQCAADGAEVLAEERDQPRSCRPMSSQRARFIGAIRGGGRSDSAWGDLSGSRGAIRILWSRRGMTARGLPPPG